MKTLTLKTRKGHIFERVKRDLMKSELWIGLDIGKNETIAYILQWGKAYSIKHPYELFKLIGDATATVLLENTGIYSVPYEDLDSEQIRIWVINGINSRKEKNTRKKNDPIDAIHLAKILKEIYDASESEFLNLPAISKPLPLPQRLLRMYIKERERVKRELNRYKNKLEKLLYLVDMGGKKLHGYKSIVKIIDELQNKTLFGYEEEIKSHLLRLFKIYLEYLTIKEELDRKITDIIEREKNRDYEKLMKIPGMYSEFAQFLIAVYWNPGKFENKDEFKAYLKAHQRYDMQSGKQRGKSKYRLKNGLFKKYMYLFLLSKSRWSEEMVKAYEHYRNRYPGKFAKYYSKFSSWFLKKVFLYWKYDKPITFQE